MHNRLKIKTRLSKGHPKNLLTLLTDLGLFTLLPIQLPERSKCVKRVAIPLAHSLRVATKPTLLLLSLTTATTHFIVLYDHSDASYL